MIRLADVSTRRAPFALGRLTLAWDPGVSCILRIPEDGGPLLLALIAGRAPYRTGTVRVFEGDPADPGVRRRVAYVPLRPWLPDALRVDEALALAATLRAEPVRDASARLAVLGVEMLARREVRSLSRDEARAVSLVEGLTSSRVRMVLVEEPLVAIDPRAAARLADALRAKGRAGGGVVFTTGSPRDAGDIADDVLLLRRGVVHKRAASVAELGVAAPDRARLRVVARDGAGARALVAALALEAGVAGIERETSAGRAARESTVIHLQGASAAVLAKAAARAAIAGGIDVLELGVEPPSVLEGATEGHP